MSSKNLPISLSSLNKEQREAVTAPLEPCLVVEGAGTRREKILIKRAFYLVKELGIKPEKIFLLTHTSKTAEKIKEKFSLDFQGEDFFKKVNVFDFYKFCENILRDEGKEFDLCDDNKAECIVRKIIEDSELAIISYSECIKLILRLKKIQKLSGKEITLEDYLDIGMNYFNFKEEVIQKKYPFDVLKKIWKEYETTLGENKLMSSDDILFEVNKLLDNTSIIRKLDKEINAILFDEFQDIDPLQFEIFIKIAKNKRNIYCVGDPEQAIFGFVGKMNNPFEEFLKYFSDAKIVKILRNYYSSPSILKVVNKLINKNRKRDTFLKHLIPIRKSQQEDMLEIINFTDENKEAEWVAEKIWKLIKESKGNFKNFAILFRNWICGRKINKVFFEYKIPFFSEELKCLLNKEEIQDILAYLKLAFEKDEKEIDVAILRIINKPQRKISRKFLEKLGAYADRTKITFSEAIKFERNDKKIYGFLNLWEEIKNIALDASKSLRKKFEEILERAKILDYFSKFDNTIVNNFWFLLDSAFENGLNSFQDFKEKIEEFRKYDPSKNYVYLSTIHTSKGKQFNYVFVISMNEGIMPSMQALKGKQNFESEEKILEERRVAYVAFTRAKKGLFLCSFGNEEQTSRFIKDVEICCSKSNVA